MNAWSHNGGVAGVVAEYSSICEMGGNSHSYFCYHWLGALKEKHSSRLLLGNEYHK